MAAFCLRLGYSRDSVYRSSQRPLSNGVLFERQNKTILIIITHPAPREYHDEIISLVCIQTIHTKYGEPRVIMVFRRAMQKALCLTPLPGPELAQLAPWMRCRAV
jgi:hypothetical protein